MNIADSIYGDRILDLTSARLELEQRLRNGRQVGGLTLEALLDGELYGENFRSAGTEVISILTSEYPDTPLLQSRLIERVIKSYLDKSAHLVHECACEMLYEEES